MRERLINKAIELHGNITPCNGWSNWDNCFTDGAEMGLDGVTIFWFNKPCGSTAILKSSQLN